MKKTIPYLFIAALLFVFLPVKAQYIGIESPIREKNLMIGLKVGVNAMDMAYAVNREQQAEQFVNHSVLYSRSTLTDIHQLLSCMMGGITFERTLPHFSYGLELTVNGLNAKDRSGKHHMAKSDSAYYASVRIPVRVSFLKHKRVSPYVFAAPELSTYISMDSIPVLGNSIHGYSVWNNYGVSWGNKYATPLNLNILAGAGINVKIDISDYQFWARFEAAYKLGLLNTVPKKVLPDTPDTEITRKMRGWEATIGLSFPLFKNPSYHWLM